MINIVGARLPYLLRDLRVGGSSRPSLAGLRAGAWIPSRTDDCCSGGAAELRAVAGRVSVATVCSGAGASASLGVAVASRNQAAASHGE